jgi:hypothetical protein
MSHINGDFGTHTSAQRKEDRHFLTALSELSLSAHKQTPLFDTHDFAQQMREYRIKENGSFLYPPSLH